MRLKFIESNILNITQQDTPTLGFLSDELIKIILSYMSKRKQVILFDINKHYRRYKMMTCYYKLNELRSYEYYLNLAGIRDRIENSLANPNQQIALSFQNKSISDVSSFANVHSLKLYQCTNCKDLSSLTKLSSIEIQRCKGVTDISSIANVNTLILSSVSKKLSKLPSNLNVKNLTLSFMENLQNLEGLANCTALKVP